MCVCFGGGWLVVVCVSGLIVVFILGSALSPTSPISGRGAVHLSPPPRTMIDSHGRHIIQGINQSNDLPHSECRGGVGGGGHCLLWRHDDDTNPGGGG